MRARRGWLLLVSVSLSACMPVFSSADFGEPRNRREEALALAEAYGRSARSLAALPDSFRGRERAARHGIEIVDVLRGVAVATRLDTAELRGPNLGIEVRLPTAGSVASAVLAPNLRSLEAPWLEVRLDRFFVRVGNHHGEPLQTVAVSRFLSDVGRYVTSPASLTGAAFVGERVSLSATFESQMLVEVRAIPVPLPARGIAAVRPVVWSRASAPRCPAMLAIVVSRGGTSVRVIETRPEDLSALGSGQALDFNHGGERRPFAVAAGSTEAIAVIEVPLLSPRVQVRDDDRARGRAAAPRPAGITIETAGNLDSAGGTTGGPFAEGYGDRVERDERQPIRATVFLLYPVAGGELTDDDWEALAGRLRATSGSVDAVGAVVLPDTDARRTMLRSAAEARDMTQ